jgi:hypothetical protein
VRGAALPTALLLAALGFALAFAPPRVRVWSIAALIATLAVLSPVAFPPGWIEVAFLGCWVSTVGAALAVHLPRGLGMAGGLALSVNAGFWAHVVVEVSGASPDLATAMPAVVLALPATWLIRRGASIAVKVASSWLVAIAILAAVLPFLAVTPGYLPDHLE